jgi:hypothetical protein
VKEPATRLAVEARVDVTMGPELLERSGHERIGDPIDALHRSSPPEVLVIEAPEHLSASS